MKKSSKITKLFVLALAALLVCTGTAAADAAFTFRHGVTWASTVADMMAAEGMHDYDADFHQNTISDTYTRYYIMDADLGSIAAFYVYHADTPVMMYITLPDDTRAVPVYELKAAEYTELYGAPADYTVEELYTLMDVIWTGHMTQADYTRVTAWTLADGTLAVLFTFRGDNVMAYFCTDRLESQP